MDKANRPSKVLPYLHNKNKTDIFVRWLAIGRMQMNVLEEIICKT